jgi:hypothetical protein
MFRVVCLFSTPTRDLEIIPQIELGAESSAFANLFKYGLLREDCTAVHAALLADLLAKRYSTANPQCLRSCVAAICYSKQHYPSVRLSDVRCVVRPYRIFFSVSIF